MKKSKLFVIALAVIMMVGVLTSVSALTLRAAPGAGVWAEVCCGWCGGLGDYCIGNGPYVCCKGGDPQQQ